MPGYFTHIQCARAAQKAAPQQLQLLLERFCGAYLLGAQGPDILQCARPLARLTGLWQDWGGLLHKRDTRFFWQSALRFIKGLAGRRRQAALCYLLGYATHQALDASAHPFVLARSSLGGRHNPLAHARLETALDLWMLERDGLPPPDAQRGWRLMCAGLWQERLIAALLADALSASGALGACRGAVWRAMQLQKLAVMAAPDPGSKKRDWLLRNRRRLPSYAAPLRELLYHGGIRACARDWGNESRAPWQHPSTGRAHCESFLDLYAAAVERACAMADALCRFLDGALSEREAHERLGGDIMLEDWKMRGGAPRIMEVF